MIGRTAPKTIVVVGGGPAGVWAAVEAKKTDPIASVVLLTNEPFEPYEKPTLSKAFLARKIELHDCPILKNGGLAASGITVRQATCTALDPDARVLATTGGLIKYDALVLATGASPRTLALFPATMPHVFHLRSASDAIALREQMTPRSHVLIVGAGLIGLEVAATAVRLGLDATVIEADRRVMARVCPPEISDMLLDEHFDHGVKILLGTLLSKAETMADGRIAAETTAGERFVADLVVIATGVTPADGLAASAGLAVDNGILIDASCRTSDPYIFAAGDVACFPREGSRARLENWLHAQDQGAIAGRNSAGAAEIYKAVPSFWSEQYNLYIQGIGWFNHALPRIRRILPGHGQLLFGIDGETVVYAVGVNAQRELGAVRRLIDRAVPVGSAALADPNRPLSGLLKPLRSIA